MLGDEGREVRCTSCFHIWHQDNTGENDTDETEDGNSVPDLVFEERLPKEEDFAEMEDDIPEAVMPLPVDDMPDQAYTPTFSMSARQSTVLTFLFLTFVSLISVFLFKKTLVNAMPSMTAFYEGIGMTTTAPGEGLRLSGLSAEYTLYKNEKPLILRAQLENITDEKRPYPALKVTLYNSYGAVLKTWRVAEKENPPLDGGNGMPIELRFDDAPGDGARAVLEATT